MQYLSFIRNVILGCWNIKIYIKMKRNQSLEKRSPIEDLLFTVHIVSAKMDKQYTHDYFLYFQKNLQILGRYQMSPKQLKKEQKFYFQMPNSIEHFRVLNDKNLEFKWTLYIQRNSGNYQHEQYMQSKKALLKWCWDVYEQSKEKIHTVQLTVNYIFIIGEDNQSIVKSIRHYYDQNRITPTKIAKTLKGQKSHLILPPPPITASKSLSYIALKQQESFHQLKNRESVTYPVKIPNQLKFRNAKVQYEKERSHIIQRSEESHSIASQTPSEEQTPNRSGKNKDKFPITNSEIQIVNEIQQRLKQTEQIIDQDKEGFNIQNHVKYQSKFIRDQVFLVKNITNSQYFNEKGEIVIRPFYIYYKYWLIILGILFIFYGLLYLGPKPPKISKNHHHKEENHSHEQHHGKKHKKKSKNHNEKKEHKQKSHSRKQKK